MKIAQLLKIIQFRNIKIEQNPIALHRLIMEVQAVEVPLEVPVEVREEEVQQEDLGK
jgi:hypothetical protein